jgi:hypothetical protein
VTTGRAKNLRLRVTFLRHQETVFDCPARNVVYVKGRRAGGTRGAVSRLVELAHQRPGSRHLWVDTVQRNVDKVVARYFRPVLSRAPYKWDATNKVLTFVTSAHCDFGSAERPENLEGWAYDFIWVNEAGHVLRDESIYYNTLLPMMLESSQSQRFFIGTPKGPGLFQSMFGWGQPPEHEHWKSFRHASHRNSLLSKDELARLREHMPEREYRQEILAEFLEGEGAVFRDVASIATAKPETEGHPGVKYCIGVDLARYGDYTVAWVGRADLRAGVWCERFQRLSWKLQVERLASLAKRFPGSPIYVDATGVGDPVCDDLVAAGLPVVRTVLTASTKRDLIDALAVSIEQQRLTIIPDETTLRELEAYEVRALPSGANRLSAPPGLHDDCVIALALCHWGMGRGGEDLILGSAMVTSEFPE